MLLLTLIVKPTRDIWVSVSRTPSSPLLLSCLADRPEVELLKVEMTWKTWKMQQKLRVIYSHLFKILCLFL